MGDLLGPRRAVDHSAGQPVDGGRERVVQPAEGVLVAPADLGQDLIEIAAPPGLLLKR